MTTNEEDIICHSQVTGRDGISVNLTEIERFLVTLASILRIRPDTDYKGGHVKRITGFRQVKTDRRTTRCDFEGLNPDRNDRFPVSQRPGSMRLNTTRGGHVKRITPEITA